MIDKRNLYSSELDIGMSKRLGFIRSRLGLTLSEIEFQTGINVSTLHDWENGRKTNQYSKLYLLCIYYDDYWNEKFSKSFPVYQKKQLEKITIEFLLLGNMLNDKTIQEAYLLLKHHIGELEKKVNDFKSSIKNQMDMFR